jgi:RimJ/RimL family protein N-acetyltransferase
MSCRLLETDRLTLRPPGHGDIAALTTLANDFDVARNLARMPHPYTQRDAADYVERAAKARATGSEFSYVIANRTDQTLLGSCSLRLGDDGLFNLGYWLGKPFWGLGYATEAAWKLAGFAFSGLKAGAITASYFDDNPASGHVLRKLGFKPNGAKELVSPARGHSAPCQSVLLEREAFGRKPVRRQKVMT